MGTNNGANEMANHPANLTLTKDHGITDTKGRKLGHTVHVEIQTNSGLYPAVRMCERMCCIDALPVFWEVRVQSRRNGTPFGAFRKGTVCETREQAIALAEKKIAALKPGRL